MSRDFCCSCRHQQSRMMHMHSAHPQHVLAHSQHKKHQLACTKVPQWQGHGQMCSWNCHMTLSQQPQPSMLSPRQRISRSIPC